ncbi:ABC transporter substrate-binding protein [Microbacterium sp. CH1]|uniref:ABC transporter substrate-binding protein n=1 Tax=Microbacterium sp. CH1 TaxID=1770208 RepID=UPI001E517758|nr:ABC transporter substrate-binding protein [Microbacterium sp. CH1]
MTRRAACAARLSYAGSIEAMWKRQRRRAWESIAGGAAIAAILAGCTAIPADVDGTLDRVEEGEVRVGITHNPPWTDTTDPSDPAGEEVRLVEEFAETLDATVVWTVDSEANLAERLHDHALDLAIGGFTDDTPWVDKAAMTVPFDDATTAGETKKHVMLTVLGENRFLTTLETFLLERGGAR